MHPGSPDRHEHDHSPGHRSESPGWGGSPGSRRCGGCGYRHCRSPGRRRTGEPGRGHQCGSRPRHRNEHPARRGSPGHRDCGNLARRPYGGAGRSGAAGRPGRGSPGRHGRFGVPGGHGWLGAGRGPRPPSRRWPLGAGSSVGLWPPRRPGGPSSGFRCRPGHRCYGRHHYGHHCLRRGPWAFWVPQPRQPTSNVCPLQYPDKRRGSLNHNGSDPLQACPATSYSPTRSPSQYHRR